MSSWEHESEWEQCDFCDHTYRPNESCEGRPVSCARCCLNQEGEVVYTPMFVIYEEAS